MTPEEIKCHSYLKTEAYLGYPVISFRSPPTQLYSATEYSAHIFPIIRGGIYPYSGLRLTDDGIKQLKTTSQPYVAQGWNSLNLICTKCEKKILNKIQFETTDTIFRAGGLVSVMEYLKILGFND